MRYYKKTPMGRKERIKLYEKAIEILKSRLHDFDNDYGLCMALDKAAGRIGYHPEGNYEYYGTVQYPEVECQRPADNLKEHGRVNSVFWFRTNMAGTRKRLAILRRAIKMAKLEQEKDHKRWLADKRNKRYVETF